MVSLCTKKLNTMKYKLLIKVFLIVFILTIFIISKSFASGFIEENGEVYYIGEDNEVVKNEIISYVDGKYYLSPDDGHLVKRYFLEETSDGKTYYFDKDGRMVKDTWLCIKSEKVNNKCSYVPTVYWYYFKNDGSAMKSTNGGYKKVLIDGKQYLFNEYGHMLTGFVNTDGEIINCDETDNPFAEAVFYCGDDNDGVVHTGWYNYVYGYDTIDEDDYRYDLTDIYLYFNPINGKKITGKKNINNKTYLFNDEGIMLSKWDAYEQGISDEESYYGDRDDGSKAKNKWIYEVPSKDIDGEAYNDDEKKYMYYENNGLAAKNKIKKINQKYYSFDKNGIMQNGLVIFHETIGYVDTVDFDYATYEDFIKRGELATDEDKIFYIDYDGQASGNNTVEKYPNSGKVHLHYFGNDGDRKVGKNKILFSDFDATFESNNQGNISSKKKNNQYYANGFLLQTINDNKYGIVSTDVDTAYNEQNEIYEYNIRQKYYKVVDSKGKIVKSKKQSYKADDSEYWLIGGKENDNSLKGIWSCNIKYANNGNYLFTEKFDSYLIENLSSEELKDFLIVNNFINEEIFDIDTENWKFEVKKVSNNKSQIAINNIRGYMFYDEDNENKSVWTPCGILNNAKKTVCIGDLSKSDYKVEMNDEFFLNCFW